MTTTLFVLVAVLAGPDEPYTAVCAPVTVGPSESDPQE